MSFDHLGKYLDFNRIIAKLSKELVFLFLFELAEVHVNMSCG